MTRDEMAETMKKQFAECMTLREAGQKEYAHDTDNAFRNFNSIGQQLDLAPMKILWVYFKKHLDGILAHINGHTSQRENVRGRIGDAITYLCLLRGMIDEAEAVRRRGKEVVEAEGVLRFLGQGSPK